MVPSLILLATLATASPSPAPVDSPDPLKVIVTVRSSTLCSQFADHANAAIAATLQNDATLGSVVNTLRVPDLAGNPIERRNMMLRLAELADSIAKQYKAGIGEVKSLRALQSQTNDPQEKVELKAAADALGGALYRQHLIGRDLDGFLAYEYAADMRRPDDDDMMPQMMQATSADVGPYYYAAKAPTWLAQPEPVSPSILAGHESLSDDAEMAASASHDFASRLPAITGDELTAADHFTEAAGGC
jgi:hypothetical protein